MSCDGDGGCKPHRRPVRRCRSLRPSYAAVPASLIRPCLGHAVCLYYDNGRPHCRVVPTSSGFRVHSSVTCQYVGQSMASMAVVVVCARATRVTLQCTPTIRRPFL